MVQQQEYTVRVLFEIAGWQIRQLSPTAGGVYVVHMKCEPYAYYANRVHCACCNKPIPESIQALVVLHDWEEE